MMGSMKSTHTIRFRAVHVGEHEARTGAVCGGCGGFECAGIYGGDCAWEDPEAFDCDCGCGYRVNSALPASYAYDRAGFCWGNETNPSCQAVQYPPTDSNQRLFEGQTVLAQHDMLERYRLVLAEHDTSLDGTLYWGDHPVGEIRDEMWGEALAAAHGMMMFHAAEHQAHRIPG